MKPVHALAVAAVSLALVVAQALGVFGGGSPTILSPAPLLFVLPVFIGLPVLLILFLFLAIFCVWSPALLRGEVSTPRRTLVLYVVFAVLSTAWYVTGWHYGAQYEGLKYTVTCAVLSAASFSLCSLLLWRSYASPSYLRSLVAQFALFAWIGSYAVVYLGEVP